MPLNDILAEFAKKGAAIKNLGRMCDDCAFKEGTEANMSRPTMEKAALCIGSETRFNCHTKELKDAGKPCMGFLYTLQYMQAVAIENLQTLFQKKQNGKATIP